ncbi:PREDICTED: uncharacterized protein LOC105949887 [Erythranthe guttata]|uniref:uncharacterized protein LOC105949887 n=1 Tax=Erythranthe guttata TaxID=4155 RepID=UPI00064DEB7B|nr:PREDICTED: uncharacterized protein LOC105949887 [Erythranthe guttata]|eukprot:XP_012828646.1 PREDICTED: uncharacterized protein LOC105949887 [Erythranthe guttata]
MGKPKSQKKPRKGGVDFKKIKRKIGRKLPPPKNATNTEIKSKAIVLPEQSITAEKAGLAVSKKGLTLKELLQHTSHHNNKVRKGALLGIKDILLKHPAELRLNKIAVIEKLRELISDDDKLVRETLYQLFKTVIFPGCVKDNQGPLVSLMMAYIFDAMTNLALDVRLMAFKILDLVVQFYPSSFALYAEKILPKYEDIMRKKHFLEDKSKLKSILAGLIRCLSLLPSNERNHSAVKNDTQADGMLHAYEPEDAKESIDQFQKLSLPSGISDITKQLKDLLSILVGCFHDFMPSLHSTTQLDVQSCDCLQFILQSVDFIIGFLVSGICRSEPDPHILLPFQKPGAITYDQSLSPMMLKKLWNVFPLNLVHHLSGKEEDRIFMLDTVITKIYLQSSKCSYSPSALLDKFLEFIESSTVYKGFAYWTSYFYGTYVIIKTLKSSILWSGGLCYYLGLLVINSLLDLILVSNNLLLFARFGYTFHQRWNTLTHSGKVFQERHCVPHIPYTSQLITSKGGNYPLYGASNFNQHLLLQAFTEVFRNSSPESPMKLACLSVIEEMLAPERNLDANDPTLLDYQITWMHYLPSLLILLDNKSPLCSEAVLRLQLHVGQVAPVNSIFSQEFDTMQYSFRCFFSQQIDNAVCYGPFVRLGADIQELAVCCLYYFSFMDAQLLQSLVSCCLCDDIEPSMILRILEVLQSAFRAGHIQVADYTSFHVTLLSRFQVYPEKTESAIKYNGKSNPKAFKSVTSSICSCLSQIGDDYLVFQLLENIIIDQICGEMPMENKCGFLRMLVTLDSRPTRLSDQSIVKLSLALARYLIDVVSTFKEDDQESTPVTRAKRRSYYLLPSFHLFYGSKKLSSLVLNTMGSWISEPSSSLGSRHTHLTADRSITICAIGSVLFHMNKDVKIRQILLSCKIESETMLQNLLNLLSAEGTNLTLEERHKIQKAYDRMRAIASNEVV